MAVPWRFRFRGWLWDRAPAVLPRLRRLKRELALWRYRWRARRQELEPRVICETVYETDDTAADDTATEPLTVPAIAVHLGAGVDPDLARRFLVRQTESAAVLLAESGEGESKATTKAGDAASYFTSLGPELGAAAIENLPATWLESQLMCAAAADLEWTTPGWASPAEKPDPAPSIYGTGLALTRRPRTRANAPAVLSRLVPHLTAPEKLREPSTAPCPPTSLLSRSGPWTLRHDIGPGAVTRHRLRPLHQILADLPPVPGPPTALFLLPFLAVGGAERLLFDFLAGIEGRYRSLVVTLEPHDAALGQTVDVCRRHTPHVYTLGEWLPREAHRDALLHLLRRYKVETVVSWNGTALFYEWAPELSRRADRPRLVNQLFNHRGGWIEHYGPRFVQSVETHLAVNRPIARALAQERGVPEDRLAVVHHGVAVPELPSPAERAARRQRIRRELGLPPDAVVAGTFIRLHPQKRPHDVLALARRLPEIHFLLVGGGPLDAEIDCTLAEQPIENLVRLPMQSHVEPFFDALDLCLMTSAYEGLPIFLLEGLARGLPAVATAVGDVPELFAEGGGRAAPVGDLDALAAALDELRDPARRDAAGRRGRATVQARFAVERYVRELETVIFPPRPAREEPSITEEPPRTEESV